MLKISGRRCHYFDENGDPVDGGCSRPASLCAFYHPEEEGWDSAKKTRIHRGPKSRHSNWRSSLSPPNYGPGFRRDSGYSRHRRSRSRSRSKTPPRSRRRDSIASTVPEQAGSPRNSRTSHDPRTSSLTDVSPIITNKGLQQPQSSTSSARSFSPRIPKQQQQQASSSSSLINPAPSPATASQAGSLGDVPFSSSNRLPITIPWEPKAMRPSSPSRRPSLRTGHPPPGPMPPPQSLPTVPPALSAGLAPSMTAKQTPEEKRAMWEERTRIFSESELAREQLAALEEQVAWSLRIIESQYFTSQTREDQTRLKGQLAEIEKQCDEAKKLYEESVDKLFKTGSWPVGPPTTAVDDGMEEKQKEVLKYIQELKDTSLQMSKILGDISMFKSPPPLFLTSDSDDAAAMDVDQPDDDNARHKSLRRRRISKNLDGRSGDSTPSMPTQEELDEFLDRLVRMEGLISTLGNDINEHGRDAREEFELLVDTKLDEFQFAREEAERQRLEEEQQRMQGMEQDVTLTGEQVGELASEIGDLIIRVGKLEADVVASRKGRQESNERLLEVERRLEEYLSTREANVRIIQTFEKALNAYISQPPSPPATPVDLLLPFDFIFQELEHPLVQSLRSHIVHVVEELRKDVENMLRTQNAELYSTLWDKITVTLKVLEMIQSRINQGDIEPVRSLAENVKEL